MKKVSIITFLVPVIAIVGCSDVRRDPGRVYMPDMGYSRAYETYASTSNLDSHGIRYTRMPVPGTIKRGDVFPFPIETVQRKGGVHFVQPVARPSYTPHCIEQVTLFFENTNNKFF
jgi:hypothetical protein